MKTLYTIGHSTRPIEEFLEMLGSFCVTAVIDVRTIPKSRFNPQFGKEKLEGSLARAGIQYYHLQALGGLRKARSDSPNTGWRNASFRGYADYMGTAGFSAGLERLEDIAAAGSSAIMCAEAVPWRCHRMLIADALTFAGWSVCHITGVGTSSRHQPTPFALYANGVVRYPPAKEVQSLPKRRKKCCPKA